MEENEEAVIELFKPDMEEEVAKEEENEQNQWSDVEGGDAAPMTPRESPMDAENQGLGQGGGERPMATDGQEWLCEPCGQGGQFEDGDVEEGRRPGRLLQRVPKVSNEEREEHDLTH